jgi:hypothetical protein
MKNIVVVDELQHVVRRNVCTTCRFRPEGSEKLGPDVMRACEGCCSIFRNLVKLYDVATTAKIDGNYDETIIDRICMTCENSPTAGEFCTRRATKVCPMGVYGKDALKALIDFAH